MEIVSERPWTGVINTQTGARVIPNQSSADQNVSISHHRSQDVLGFLLALPLQGFTALSNAAINPCRSPVRPSSRSQSCGGHLGIPYFGHYF